MCVPKFVHVRSDACLSRRGQPAPGSRSYKWFWAIHLVLLHEQQALLTLVPFLQALEKVLLELVWSSHCKCWEVRLCSVVKSAVIYHAIEKARILYPLRFLLIWRRSQCLDDLGWPFTVPLNSDYTGGGVKRPGAAAWQSWLGLTLRCHCWKRLHNSCPCLWQI